MTLSPVIEDLAGEVLTLSLVKTSVEVHHSSREGGELLQVENYVIDLDEGSHIIIKNLVNDNRYKINVERLN